MSPSNGSEEACPCCRHMTDPGDWEICRVCYWENDPSQRRYPDQPGGANRVSLRQGQANFVEFGAAERAMLPYVRPQPFRSDPANPG